MDGFVVEPSGRCPAEQANCISRSLFWWTRKTFLKGTRRDLTMDDMFYPLEGDESELLANKLERAWNKELEKLKSLEYSPGPSKDKILERKGPSLCRAIFVVFWWDYLKVGLAMLLMSVVLRNFLPLFQKQIIGSFSASGSETVVSESWALYYATGLVLTTLSIIMVNHHSTVAAQRVAMRLRVACSSLVYRKALRLSKSALNHTTPGQIVNLLSNDVGRFDVVAALLNQLWIMPIQVLVIGAIMCTIIGPVALVGISCLLFAIVPVQFVANHYTKRFRRRIAVISDRRIQLMTELINGIQVVKMYAWESPFAKVVSNTRQLEMRAIRTTTYLKSLTFGITTFSDKLNLYVTLLAYVLLMGQSLTAEISITMATYFCILQANAAFFFPQAVIQAGEATVSIRRLQEFLMLEEVTEMIVGSWTIPSVDNNDDKKVPRHYENPTYENSDEARRRSDSNEDECATPRIPEESATANDDRDEVAFVEMQRISANWKNGQLPPTLCDVSLKIYGGEICGLVGQVGSGKSSLLGVILRELPMGAGNLYIRQKFDTDLDEFLQRRGYVTDNPNLVVSYSSQDPWLFTGTVRDNILFGQPYDSTRYEQVTRACALLRDIRQWPQADLTIVGERGMSLSGGQKARVNLARAVYKKADLYLLDDPLSAVDARVGQHLFNKCINGFLKGKTRILVTHQLQYLKSVDTIVLLDRGLVRAQGTYQDLCKSSPGFTSLLNSLKTSEEEDGQEEEEEKKKKKEKKEGVWPGEVKETILRTEERDVVERSVVTSWDSTASIDSLNTSLDWTDDATAFSPGSQRSEITIKGDLSWRVWWRYLKAGGSLPRILFLMGMTVLGQAFLTLTDYWISYWSNLEVVRSSLTDHDSIGVTREEYASFVNNTLFSYLGILDEDGLLPRLTAINVYTFLIVGCVLFNLSRCFIFMIVTMRASRTLHDSMLTGVLGAAMRFFNVNQSGWVLNRFSKDVGTMDELLPSGLLNATRIMLMMVGSLLMVVIINPWMLIPLCVLLVGIYFVTNYYLRTAYSIKRLEASCKSPVFSQVNTTLRGLATIRSNGPSVVRTLQRQFDRHQDIHSGTCYLSSVAGAAFSFWLDLFSCAFVACVCFTLVLLDDGEILGGTAGLAISQSTQLTGVLQYGIKQCAETCTFMTAIERIFQYINLKPEDSAISTNPPAPNWPSKGRLSMKNLYLNYNKDDSPVLKGINLTIEAGWKVGIVGRTGAGKSSLVSAIFRLENEGLDGEIKIDGRDTATLRLNELRSRISIIPQESVLFSGTLRYNLDPFDRYEDAALWDALREVEMTDLSLDQRVSEGGANFSVGQRQLLCLARAILKDNRILVLDEATANIDSRTDALVQKTLRTKFGRHTVITVAHRLVTVIENDRILVMDEGRVAEFGCPYELLRDNPDGPFATMVRQGGPAVADNLIELAEAACLRVSPKHSLDLESSTSTDDVPPEM